MPIAATPRPFNARRQRGSGFGLMRPIGTTLLALRAANFELCINLKAAIALVDTIPLTSTAPSATRRGETARRPKAPAIAFADRKGEGSVGFRPLLGDGLSSAIALPMRDAIVETLPWVANGGKAPDQKPPA